jgi:DNA-3-methyladenine glycosylase
MPGAAFFDRPAVAVARDLIGATLLVDGVGGVVVETEAYERDDPASHSYPGLTSRNAVMFGPPGRAYVYRSYGIHWCFNMVTGPAGHGAAVLIRALEPTRGVDIMAARRGRTDPRWLAAGPGRLGQALGIGPHHNGLALDDAPFLIKPGPPGLAIVTGPRIGISRAVDHPWRFGLAGSPWLSRGFPP